MDNPDKPDSSNWPGPFKKLFQQRDSNNGQNNGQNQSDPRWKPKPMQSASMPESLASESAAGFATPAASPLHQNSANASPYPGNHTGRTRAQYTPSSNSDLQRLTPVKTTTRKPFFQLSKTLPAFWTVTSVFSLVVNVVLITVVVLLGRELFTLKTMLGDKLLGGLYENFIYMDQAHIRTTITVANTIPINFTLPISTDTVVVLTQDTPINGANVRINTGGVVINSAANIVLPAGTNLPVHLELNVPVNTSVPINLEVPVDIPLQQTELHKPFIGLQQVVAPFYRLLQPQIKTPQDAPFCADNPELCGFYFNSNK